MNAKIKKFNEFLLL